jgi:hypothetical protein
VTDLAKIFFPLMYSGVKIAKTLKLTASYFSSPYLKGFGSAKIGHAEAKYFLPYL